MAYLIGSADTTRFSGTKTLAFNSSEFTSFTQNDGDITAAASGNAAVLSLYISSWLSATNIKACIYDENSFVESVIIPSSAGTGVITASLAGTTSITSGNSYRCALYSESGEPIEVYSDTAGSFLRYEGSGGGSYTTPLATYPVGSYDSVNEFYFAVESVASGLTIDSTDASMQRDTNWQMVVSNPSTAPTTGNTTLSVGGDTLTPSSVTGSDPYTLTFPVGDLTKQVDATGYDWTLTVDAETATTGNIPLTIQSGYTLVDLVSPDTTNASLLFGVTGDTPVTGDHLEYDVTSTLDSGVTLSVAATGVWTVTEAVEGDWVTDITVSRRVVQANGTIGTEAVVTLSAATGLTTITSLVTPLVSSMTSSMVN